MPGGTRRAGYPPQVGPGVLPVRRNECPSGRVPIRRMGDRRWAFFSSLLQRAAKPQFVGGAAHRLDDEGDMRVKIHPQLLRSLHYDLFDFFGNSYNEAAPWKDTMVWNFLALPEGYPQPNRIFDVVRNTLAGIGVRY